MISVIPINNVKIQTIIHINNALKNPSFLHILYSFSVINIISSVSKSTDTLVTQSNSLLTRTLTPLSLYFSSINSLISDHSILFARFQFTHKYCCYCDFFRINTFIFLYFHNRQHLFLFHLNRQPLQHQPTQLVRLLIVRCDHL